MSDFNFENFNQLSSFAAKKRYLDEKLPRIGSGSGRVVYDFGDNKVLKFAKNRKGVAQNEIEADIGFYQDTHHIVTKVFDFSDDNVWLIAEKAKKVNEKRIKELTGIPSLDLLNYYLRNFDDQNHGKRAMFNHIITPEIKEELDNNDFVIDLLNFTVNYSQSVGDMGRSSSYGEVLHDGQPSIVLTDYGLNDEVYSNYYSPERKRRVYELVDMNHEDELTNFIDASPENVMDGGYGTFAIIPFSVSDGENNINENVVKFVENIKIPKKAIKSMNELYEIYAENRNNVKEGIKKAKNKRIYFDNLIKLQRYLKEYNNLNEDLFYWHTNQEPNKDTFNLVKETINEAGLSSYSTVRGMTDSDIQPNEYFTEERIMSYMHDSQAVNVKKKCRLGGLGHTSVACNQGDINNLELTKINESDEDNKKVKLSDVYSEIPYDDEMLWGFIGKNDYDKILFEVKKLNPKEIYLTYNNGQIKDSLKHATKDQIKLIRYYENKVNEHLNDYFVVDTEQKILINGYHRLIAFVKKDIKTINAVDLSSGENTINENIHWNGKAYHVNSGFSQKRGTTAGDVVRFERDELGNSEMNIPEEKLAKLDKHPARDIVWVTKSFEDAKRYSNTDDNSDIEEFDVHGEVIAEDGDGGYLVLTNNNLNEEIDASEAYDDDGALQTIIDGKRDVAFIHMTPYYIDLANKSNLGMIKLDQAYHNLNAYIVYRNKDKAERLIQILKNKQGYANDQTPEEAREIGKLLGYSDKSIDKYINRLYYKSPDGSIKRRTSDELLKMNEEPKKEISEEIYHYYYPKHRGELTFDKVVRRVKNTQSLATRSDLFNTIGPTGYKELKKFNSPEEIMDHIYWHGSGGGVYGGLKAGFNIVKKGNEGGGGYGEQYHTISVSKNKNKASNFTGMSSFGKVYPVLLRKGATVEEMPHIQDSDEIEDILVDLWLRKVDAVKIGDWNNKEFGEEELVILNPKAIVKFEGEGYPVYHKKRFTNPDLSTYQAIYNTLKNTPPSKENIKVQYPENKEIQEKISENEINENVYRVYHGTNEIFNNFDIKKSAQGIIWFTDDIDSIKSGEHGGSGNKYILTRDIIINNPAGWKEYDKYGIQQIEDMGYDGIILPQGSKNDYIIFNTKNIKKTKKSENLNEDEDFPEIEKQIDKDKTTHGLDKKLIGNEDGVKVYVVNGEQVRDNGFIEWVDGGNHYVDAYLPEEKQKYAKFIPEDEIWVDDVFLEKPKDLEAIILHEKIESYIMKNYGFKYDPAHNIANSGETLFRKKVEYIDDNERIEKQIFDEIFNAIVKLAKEKSKKDVEEGLGDKLFDKITNPEAHAEDNLKKEKSAENKEEIITFNYNNKDRNIVKNPKNLNSVGYNVKGVVDKEGNLYVEQVSGLFHVDILNILSKLNIIRKPDPNWYKILPQDFIIVERYGDTNKFLIGESNSPMQPDEKRDKDKYWYNVPSFKIAEPIFQKYLDKAKQKNPDLKFINQMRIEYELGFNNVDEKKDYLDEEQNPEFKKSSEDKQAMEQKRKEYDYRNLKQFADIQRKMYEPYLSKEDNDFLYNFVLSNYKTNDSNLEEKGFLLRNKAHNELKNNDPENFKVLEIATKKYLDIHKKIGDFYIKKLIAFDKKYKNNSFGMAGNANTNEISHFTTTDSAISIIEDGYFTTGEEGGVSTTTNKNLVKDVNLVFYYPQYKDDHGKTSKNLSTQFVLDFNKIKADKIKYKIGNEFIGTHYGEEEIRIKPEDEELDLYKYLKKVIFDSSKETNKEAQNELINLLKEKNIKYYIKGNLKEYVEQKNESVKFLNEISLESIKHENIITPKYIDYLMRSDGYRDYLDYFKYEYNLEDLEDDELENRPEFEDWLNNELIGRFYNILDNLEHNIKSDGTIDIWRKMTVEENWINHLITSGKHLGIYWTWDENSAEAHWGISSRSSDALLKTSVKEEYVNWEDTIILNMDPYIGDQEKEIRLFKNTALKIEELYFDDEDIMQTPEGDQIRNKTFYA